MEWGRAKTILIVSFLFLNVLLGYQLWAGKIDMETSSDESIGISHSVHQVMKNKGIRLGTTLPKATPKLGEITVKFADPLKANTRITLESPIESRIFDRKKDLKETLAKQITQANQYQWDEIASTHDMFVMNQLYDNYPMFEVNLRLYTTEKQIFWYRQNYVEVHSESPEKKQKVLPALTAVGRLAENLLSSGTVIKDVRLGYHGQIYNSETQVLAPTWRIATADGALYYVHAITGAVEAPQKEN